MTLDNAACYRALTARDPRFDGVFFVGVTSTGIYCRPVCRARTPRRTNCRFFSHAAAAERMGFRPCLRCRPELAPGASQIEATSALAAQAARRIAAGALNAGGVDALARELSVTARHLRRSVQQHLGVSPIELATTHRLLLAKRLLHETSLPVTQVAYASGFESARRFNDAFKRRYRLAPGELRRDARATEGDAGAGDAGALGERALGERTLAERAFGDADLVLALEYRSPLDWPALLAFLGKRAAPGVERVDGERYTRSLRLAGAVGHFVVSPTPNERCDRHTLTAAISPSLLPVLMPLLARIRDLFDLDANPDVIAEHLVRGGVPGEWATIAATRIPGSVDPFELTVRAILGQQVSVKGATTLMSRFVTAFGEPYAGHAQLSHLAPTAERVAKATSREMSSLGVPAARAEAIRRLAMEVARGSLSLAPGGDVRRTMEALVALPGIGEWTANYIAMRALRWPDAFPSGDLILRKAAGDLTPRALVKHADAWRPWRAYAAMALWRSYGTGADKTVTHGAKPANRLSTKPIASATPSSRHPTPNEASALSTMPSGTTPRHPAHSRASTRSRA